MATDIARTHMQRYGEYPVAITFTNNDHVADLPDTEQPAYSAAYDASEKIKRHAACDECRKRKLKCSGEPTGCSRCVKQNLLCHYSEQKQMGRPRKRQKTESEVPSITPTATSPPRPIQPAPEPGPQESIDPKLARMNEEQVQFERICNAPLAQSIRTNRQASFQDSTPPGLQSTNSDATHSQNGEPTPDAFDPFNTVYPTDIAQWPDFSTLDALPLPVEDKWRSAPQMPLESFDPDVDPEALSNLPSVPACPCLPNLYLTLSTMSTLSSFPFTQQTITTIEAGYRTARGVIYCPVCPQKFDTGSSNLMLGCTLLNVLSDQWNRFRRLSVDDIRKSFGSYEQQNSIVTTKEGRAWRDFAHQMLRAYVFGDQTIPLPPGSAQSLNDDLHIPQTEPAAIGKSPPLTLMGLCDSLTRRQRQWHHLEEATDEFPDRVTSELQHGHMVGASSDHPGKHLCLEIVNHARCVVTNLDQPLHHH